MFQNGTNLESVPCKAKKPNLYPTALLSHLFTDEQMRCGCVEPKEGSKKNVLNQSKVDLIKSKCTLAISNFCSSTTLIFNFLNLCIIKLCDVINSVGPT